VVEYDLRTIKQQRTLVGLCVDDDNLDGYADVTYIMQCES